MILTVFIIGCQTDLEVKVTVPNGGHIDPFFDRIAVSVTNVSEKSKKDIDLEIVIPGDNYKDYTSFEKIEYLGPGETETVVFSLFGIPSGRYELTANARWGHWIASDTCRIIVTD